MLAKGATGDKPLSDQWWLNSLMHICVTWFQWVNAQFVDVGVGNLSMKRCSEDINDFVFQMFVFGTHWSLTEGLVSIWCNAFCPRLFATNVILLHLSSLIRSTPKYIWKKWGQRNFSNNVNNKRSFSTCFLLLNTCSAKGILNPLSWLRLAGLYVIEAPFHMLPPDAHWPADLFYPGATADWPVEHWTQLQDSPTVASTVTRTRIPLWWNILYVPVDEHIQRSYTLTSKFAFIAYWSNW